MSDRFRDILTVTVIVVALLLALWGVLALRRGGDAAPPQQAARGAPVADQEVQPPTSRPSRPRVAAAFREPRETVSSASPGTAEGTRPAPPAWTKREPADFTPEDLLQCGRGVRVDVGTYAGAVGTDIEVQIRITAPALESCTLVLQYDKGVLAVVPGSAAPTGPQFRSGIECYAAEESGRLVVIHSGIPGRKNLDASAGSTASVSCRMRALRPGKTRLLVLPESSFTNGRGEEEAFDVSGGEVSIH